MSFSPANPLPANPIPALSPVSLMPHPVTCRTAIKPHFFLPSPDGTNPAPQASRPLLLVPEPRPPLWLSSGLSHSTLALGSPNYTFYGRCAHREMKDGQQSFPSACPCPGGSAHEAGELRSECHHHGVLVPCRCTGRMLPALG